MNSRQFVALEKKIVAVLPDFRMSRTKKWLIYVPPVDRLLRGVCFEPSGWDPAGFYMTMFVMPLCVPRDYVYFTFGERVREEAGRGSDMWNVEGTPPFFPEVVLSLREHALPFLHRLANLEAFVAFARSREHQHCRLCEVLGYALARLGRTTEAIEVLNKALAVLGTEIAWHIELAARIRELIHLLLTDPSEAQRQFARTEEEMAQRFGLAEFSNAA